MSITERTIKAIIILTALMVLLISASAQKRNQLFHLIQFQINTISIQSHFPQISIAVLDTDRGHLFTNSMFFLW